MTVAEALTWINKLYQYLNKELFHFEQDPQIIVAPQQKTRMYGWFSKKPCWSKNGVQDVLHEVNICAEHLNRTPHDIAATLIHELCHYYNKINGIKDTSRAGQYHNFNFKKTAEEFMLDVSLVEGVGYSATKLSTDGRLFISQAIMQGHFIANPFNISRTDTEVVQEKTSSNSRKYKCSCDVIFRATRDDVDATCNICNQKFVIEN